MIANAKVILIYAKESETNAVGLRNSIPWFCPHDMKYFREKTVGNVCVVGSGTAKDLPELKGRTVLVLSESGREGTYTVKSLKQYIQTNKIGQIFVIGGVDIYHYFLNHDLADEVFENIITFHNKKISYDKVLLLDKQLSKFKKEEISVTKTFEYDIIYNHYFKTRKEQKHGSDCITKNS